MSTVKALFHAVALSAVVSSVPVLASVANAAGLSAAGFHAYIGTSGGFHGGLQGGGARGFNRMRDFRGHDPDWHHYGYWQNGAWIGIWPGYYEDAYNQAWDYYCDPESPYFERDVCSDQ